MQSLIVIPTYNEKENVQQLVPELRRLMPEVDILVVDDNSPDGTGEIVRKMGATDSRVHLLARPGKQGLGRAYIAG
ncbi:MAG: glycosyltransferase, partial [Bdellovibrionales bacterium]